MRLLKFKNIFPLIILIFFFFFHPKASKAELYCSFYGDVITIDLGKINNVNINVTNDGPASASKVKFTNERGEGIFKIINGNASGWQVNIDGENIIFSGNKILSGQTVNFSLQIQGISEADEDHQGLNAFLAENNDFIECGGGRGVLVINPPPTSTPIIQPTSTPASQFNSNTANINQLPTPKQSSTLVATPTPTPLIDRQPPTVFLTTDFSKPFKAPPKILGKTVDTGEINQGISQVFYSTDGGKNWLPVDRLNCQQKTLCFFEFTPLLFDDGNYPVKVRVGDLSGNYGYSAIYFLIIDQIAPQVGPLTVISNSLIVYPEGDTFFLVNEIDYQFQFKAIGGPVNIDLLIGEDKFSLTKNLESNIWLTKINFKKTGEYLLKAISIDGAKNITEKKIGKVVVAKKGKITNGGNIVKNSRIEVFIYSPLVADFVLWDGGTFGQRNPFVSPNGEYVFFLHPGKYFIQVRAKNYQLWQSEIFEVNDCFILNQDLKLERQKGINLGFFYFPFKSKITYGKILPKKEIKNSHSLEGELIPDFSLNFGNRIWKKSDLEGKKTIVSFLSTYHPETSNQLRKLKTIKDFSSVAVFSYESSALVDVFKKRGGYENEIFADEEGIVSQAFQLVTTPTHYFINDEGKIFRVTTGSLKERIN